MTRKESGTPKRESAEKDQCARNHRDSSVESCIVLAISTIVAAPHVTRSADSEASMGKESPVTPDEQPIKSEEEDRIGMLMSLSMVEPSGQCKATTPEPLDFSCHEHQKQKCETLPILVDYGIPEQRFEEPTTEERSDTPAMKDTPGSIPDLLLRRNPQKATATYLETIAVKNKIAKEEELQKKLQDKMDYNCNVILDCDVSIDVERRAIESARRRGRPFWIPWSMERQRYLTSKRKNLQKKNAEMEGVRKRRCKKLDGLMSEKQKLEEDVTAY
ncbi:hypothetical protein Focb16_v004444 [Fusarium oxysporum f. sp. cubense]|uniref:Uncharacterized protein n=1 Tax=Fusarium oxysporum f. sp. cubense TaxID=61366 RepID=A0A559LHQ4_FUSOC|nr:hypothetical protein Focb16_v004444 [Fusarium oxysporum f. sp. cubense]